MISILKELFITISQSYFRRNLWHVYLDTAIPELAPEIEQALVQAMEREDITVAADLFPAVARLNPVQGRVFLERYYELRYEPWPFELALEYLFPFSAEEVFEVMEMLRAQTKHEVIYSRRGIGEPTLSRWETRYKDKSIEEIREKRAKEGL